MSKVLRYNAIGDCAQSDTGDFVEFEDYAALIAERDALRESLQECADRLEIHITHSEDLVAHMKATSLLYAARSAP